MMALRQLCSLVSNRTALVIWDGRNRAVCHISVGFVQPAARLIESADVTSGFGCHVLVVFFGCLHVHTCVLSQTFLMGWVSGYHESDVVVDR